MKKYMLAKGVVTTYRNSVKGNANTPHEQVQLKLTRNIMLAHKYESPFTDVIIYAYGKLHIFVRGNQIIGLVNNVFTPKGFRIDKAEYKAMNKILGITH
ncbi:TPA: hypothetical protein ACLBZX_005107 [Bacillus cereus]|uniref:hypothetical protein n=1 Tax=unclassified Bacillus cereus group TaxID=2750818 RepID=UPI00391E6684